MITEAYNFNNCNYCMHFSELTYLLAREYNACNSGRASGTCGQGAHSVGICNAANAAAKTPAGATAMHSGRGESSLRSRESCSIMVRRG